MTREEILVLLKEMKQNTINGAAYDDPKRERKFIALDEAIKELEQQPCEDAISMMDLLNNLHKHFSKGFETDEWWNSTHVLQAVKDCRPELFDLNYVPSVQPKQIECEDAISRKAILDYQYTIDESETLGISTRNVVNVDDILNAKSVQPKPKTGRWIYEKRKRLINETDEGAEYVTDYWCKCSNCGGDFGYRKMEDAFCKYCGARMVEPQEHESEE